MWPFKKLDPILPLNIDELDKFVNEIVREFNLPPGDDTYESIATLIMHMPQKCCRAPKSFFAESVLKSMANQAAYAKLKEFNDKRKAKEDEAKLKLVKQEDNNSLQGCLLDESKPVRDEKV